jgi:hypothetical protein
MYYNARAGISVSFQEKVRKDEHRVGNFPLVFVSCSDWDTIQKDQNIVYDCMDCDYNWSLIQEKAIPKGAPKRR